MFSFTLRVLSCISHGPSHRLELEAVHHNGDVRRLDKYVIST